jgi:hypothetical protein
MEVDRALIEQLHELCGQILQSGRDREGWIKAWGAYVRIACRGIAPGAAHTYQQQCQSLWDAGAVLEPSRPLAGVERYLKERVQKAAQDGKPTPKLRWLVEDLPGWLEQRSRVVPASAPRKRDENVDRARSELMAQGEFCGPPPELLAALGKIGRGGEP